MELICDKEHWTCTYMNWSKIRNECVRATFAYVEHFIQTNTMRVNNEEKRLQDNILLYISKIKSYKCSNEHLINADLHLYSGFLEECKHIEFIDLLVKAKAFDANGVKEFAKTLQGAQELHSGLVDGPTSLRFGIPVARRERQV